MSFLRNPFQKKYIPVLICAALAVACFAAVGACTGGVAFVVMAILNWTQADRPLTAFYTHAYCAMAAICLALGIFAIFSSTWPLVISSFALGSLPVSIVFTRKGPS